MKYQEEATPDEILEKIKEKGIDLIAVDALKLASASGIFIFYVITIDNGISSDIIES